VNQAVLVGQDLDEGAVRFDPLDRAVELLADLRWRVSPWMIAIARRRLEVAGGDLDGPVVLDVDAGAVESTIDRMVLPPGPITLRIWSTSILIWKMRGAYWEISGRARRSPVPSRRAAGGDRGAPAPAPARG